MSSFKLLVIVFFSLFAIIGTSTNTYAAENQKQVTLAYSPEKIIVLKDGSRIYCRIIEEREAEIYIETEVLGKFAVPHSEIAEVMDLTNNKWFANPNDTRLFFAPTARNLKKGKGYFQDIYVFLGSANYGLTDNFSIGGMITFIPFIGIDQQVIAITPKFGAELYPDLHIAAGALYAFSPRTIGQLGVLYGLATYGSSDSNVTLGGGFGINVTSYSNNGISNIIGLVGGMHRVTEHIALITENWAILNTGTRILIFSGGVRFFGDRLSADLGFASPLISTGGVPFPLIPYVDFVFNF